MLDGCKERKVVRISEYQKLYLYTGKYFRDRYTRVISLGIFTDNECSLNHDDENTTCSFWIYALPGLNLKKINLWEALSFKCAIHVHRTLYHIAMAIQP